jgi:hypothetical protein
MGIEKIQEYRFIGFFGGFFSLGQIVNPAHSFSHSLAPFLGVAPCKTLPNLLKNNHPQEENKARVSGLIM